MTNTVSRTHDTLAHVLDATGRRVSRHDLISDAYAEAERLNGEEPMSETLAQRAERLAVALDDAAIVGGAQLVRALAAANAELERERDRLREALRNVLPHAWAAEYHDDWIGSGVRREACVAAEAALTPAPEASNDGE